MQLPVPFLERHCLAVAAAIGLLASCASQGMCDPPAREYRRVLVPAEHPESWPRNGKSLLPIEAREFDQWVKAANQPPSTATILEAEYSARFAGNRLADTSGWWKVDLPGKHASQLPLERSAIAITHASWRGPDAPAARLGWSSSGGREMSRQLDVPAAGVLDFQWHLIGQTSSDDDAEFRLDFPPAARTRLVLDLPAFKRPEIAGSALLQSPESLERGGRWILALAPQREQQLKITDARRLARSASTNSLSQTCRYSIHRTGIDLEATLELTSRGKPPNSLAVRLPRRMQLVSAESDGTQLQWHLSPSGPGESNLVSIELPPSSIGGKLPISLRAWGSFVADAQLQLALLGVDNLFWTSGAIDLQIEQSLALAQLAARDCQQTTAEMRDSALHHDRIMSFAAFSPEAVVDVTIGHRSFSGNVQTGLALELGGAEIAGRVVSRVEIERGNVHQLAATLGAAWNVDAVESLPADVLGEWYVDKSATPPVLRLQLQREISAGEAVEFVSTVRLPAAATESISIDALNPFSWRQLQSAGRLLQLRPAELYDLEIDGEWNELSASRLPSGQRALLAPAENARTAMVADDDQATIRLLPKKVAYDATVQVDATVAGQHCDLAYRMTCNPRGGGIDHVLVYFAQPPGERLQWIDADSSRPLNVEKMPNSDPRFGGLPEGGELWRLEFGRLYARPITLLARRTIVWGENRQIPLISLPDAASQQGRVTVASPGRATPSLVARNMAPAPLPLETNSSAEVFAVYRFQPTRFYDSAAPPELSVAPDEATDRSRPIAARVDIHSRYGMDGAGMHRARLKLSAVGTDGLELRFPNGFVVTGARVDDNPIPVAQSSQITIPRLNDAPTSAVEVEFVSQGRPLTNGSRLESPLPLGKYSIIAGEWVVELPTGLEAALVTGESEPNWRERLFGVLARRDARPFNPVDPGDWNLLWAQISGLVSSPAQAATAETPSATANSLSAGMAAYHFSFDMTPPPYVTVAHRQATAAISLAVFLFSAVGVQLARSRMRTKIWLALAAAAASLVLPAAWAPLASAATLGLLASALWSWIQPRADRRAVAAWTAAITFSAMSVATPSHAKSPAIEQVLVPVDKDGQPVGTKYFVSTDFLRQLLAPADAANAADEAWVVGMRCDGQLLQESGKEEVDAGEWRLTFDVDAHARDTVVNLPLVKSEADWSTTASLDGIPAPIQWRAGGRCCSIRVAEPGRARLSITFVPHVEETGLQRSVALTVPPIVGADVCIVGPRGLSGLRGDSLGFDEDATANQTVYYGKLDASGQLACTWPVTIVRNSSQASRQVSQLQRLRVDPAGVDLDLKLVQRGDNEWPATIAISFDTDWQWRRDQPLDLQSSTEQLTNGRQLVVVQVPDGARREPQLSFRFAQSNASTTGRIRPPAIEVTSIPLADRWLAVACDPRLECAPSSPAGQTSNLPAKLAAELDLEDTGTRKIVVDLDRVDPDWYLDVRPAQAKSSSRDRLSIAAGKDRLRVNYRVDVVPQGADRFGWSLDVPADFVVDGVSAVEGEEQRAVDWVRARAERVNLFFERPIERAYRIELRGFLPMPTDGVLPLPKFGPVYSSNASQIVALYREDDVFAEWQFADEPPWVESGASLAPPFDEPTQFVRAFAVDSAMGQATRILVERNQPRITGSTCTRLTHSNNRWEAAWECDLIVEQGAVDTLRIQAPVEWAGPFDVSPAATLQASGLSTAGGNAVLSLRLPRQARVGDRLQLAVRSPLSTPEGQALSAPRIKLLADGQRDEFLSLPTSLEGRQISWTRSGIEPDKLPPGLDATRGAPDNFAVYRIVNDTLNVALRPRSAREELASIRLAETTTLLGAGDNTLEVTRFFISPSGLDRCNLEIPKNRLLVQANLNGHSALVRSLDANHVEVQFRHPTLPQTLDVVTQSVSGTAKKGSRIELVRPVLEESGRVIPIDLSLWTVGGELGQRLLRPQNCAALSPAELAELRLEWMTSISQRASGAVLEAAAVDGYSWFVRWAAQLTAAARFAEQAGQSSTVAEPAIRVAQPEGNAAEDPAAQSLLWIEQMAEFFNVTPAAVAEEQGITAETIEPGQLTIRGNGNVACFVSDGGREPLVVDLAPAAWSASQARYAVLASLGALALVTIWLTRAPQRLELVEQWPQAWGLILGFAAWIWLRPSLVGLAIATASAVLLVRRIQRERKSPRHDSSKLPNSIPEELA